MRRSSAFRKGRIVPEGKDLPTYSILSPNIVLSRFTQLLKSQLGLGELSESFRKAFGELSKSFRTTFSKGQSDFIQSLFATIDIVDLKFLQHHQHNFSQKPSSCKNPVANTRSPKRAEGFCCTLQKLDHASVHSTRVGLV